MALCLGPYGGPAGGALSYERGTLVRIVEPPELRGQVLSPYPPVKRERRLIEQVQPSVCFVLL